MRYLLALLAALSVTLGGPRNVQAANAPPRTMITGVDGPRLMSSLGFLHTRVEFWHDGWMLIGLNADEGVVLVCLSVFPDERRCRSEFRDACRHMPGASVRPARRSGGRQMVWRSSRRKGTTISFTRDNVAVSIYWNGGSEMGLDFADRLDRSLATGANGVRRGSFAEVPRIRCVKTRVRTRRGTEIRLRLHASGFRSPRVRLLAFDSRARPLKISRDGSVAPARPVPGGTGKIRVVAGTSDDLIAAITEVAVPPGEWILMYELGGNRR